MDIGIQQIVNVIIASATDYLVVFSPLFVVIAGLVLAFVASGYLLDLLLYAIDRYKNGNNDSFGEFREKRATDDDF